MAKRAMALIFVLILSLNTFATTVSDNDGSAFITKAEFDSLKNTFQSQIDEFNTGIDNKIDSAIAGYLAGIVVENQPVNILKSVNSSVGGTMWFKNKFTKTGSDTITTDFQSSLSRHYSFRRINNLYWSVKFAMNKPPHAADTASGTTAYAGQYLLGTALFIGKDGTRDLWTSNNRIAYNEKTIDGHNTGTNIMSYDICTDSFSMNGGDKSAKATQELVSKTVVSSKNTAGSGEAWITETKPSGRVVLKQYATQVYPRYKIDINSHTYQDFASYDESAKKISGLTMANVKNWYCYDGKLGDTRTLTAFTVDKIEEWTTKEDGEKIDDTSSETDKEKDKKTYWKVMTTMAKSTDGVDYSQYMWGAGDTTTINYQDTNITPTADSSTTTQAASDTQGTFKDAYYTPKTVKVATHTVSGQEFKYYPIKIENTKKSAENFSNDYVSSIVDDDVKIGGGIPIIKTVDADQSVEVKLKFKCQGDNATTATIYYKISDSQFVNNNFATGAEKYVTASTTPGTQVTHTIKRSSPGYIWITMYADTAKTTDTAIDTMSFKLK